MLILHFETINDHLSFIINRKHLQVLSEGGYNIKREKWRKAAYGATAFYHINSNVTGAAINSILQNVITQLKSE